MNKTARFLILLACLTSTPACRRDQAGPPTPGVPGPPAATPDGPKTYRLRGVVRKVRPETGEVTIAHEAIPGFMPAMVMPFTIKDRSTLADLHPGDEVEGPFVVTFRHGEVEASDLTALTVTRPALAPPEADPPPASSPAVLKPGEPVPDFGVTTQDGEPLLLSDLKGDVVVLTFIYTRCPLPNFCPAMDLKFADMARRLGAAPGRAGRVRLLSISFDPEHDTPATLRAHAKLRGARPPLWTYAVASHEELRRVATPLGLSYSPIPGTIEHNLRTAVIGPDGRLAALEVGNEWDPARLIKVVYSLIPSSEK